MGGESLRGGLGKSVGEESGKEWERRGTGPLAELTVTDCVTGGVGHYEGSGVVTADELSFFQLEGFFFSKVYLS